MTTLDTSSMRRSRRSYVDARLAEIGPVPKPQRVEPSPPRTERPAKIARPRTKKPAADPETCWPRSMFRRAKANAKRRGIGFTITMDDMEALVRRAAGRCEVTGIAFSVAVDLTRHRSPWKPSLDRIDSAAGYSMENVRLVCCAANLGMNTWGVEVLRAMAASMRDNGLLPSPGG